LAEEAWQVNWVKLSLVIPARNEGQQIGATINGLRQHLDDCEIVEFEILVVDDGSTDDTGVVVESIAAHDPRVLLIRNRRLHGFGRAVRFGLEKFSGEAVIVTMADGSDAPEDVVQYYRVLRDRAECAFGSRFVRGAERHGYPGFKLCVNRLANTLIRLMFGLRYNDVTNALKGYRRCVIEGCRPFVSPHFNLTIEIPLKAITRGYTYEVVPISWRNREAGTSSLVLKEQGSRYLYVLLSVWFEWLLVRRDYRRPATDVFRPWSSEDGGRDHG
jgi:dolichol-phosphate mannosyltransferase